MRIKTDFGTAFYAVIVFSAGMFAAVPQGVAQGVFTDLFGWFAQPKAPKVPTLDGNENPYGLAPRGVGPQMSYRSSRYRTVCVRHCDGYYFPISNSSPRSNFHSDAEQCQARCQGDTSLFYMPSSTADINYARDISGKAYKRLENAFLYRKKYVASCTCKPAPWSPEERARHAMYGSPQPQVALNDRALDSVAANLERAAAGPDGTRGPNPYQNSPEPRERPNDVANANGLRQQPQGHQMGLGVKAKKKRRTAVRSRTRRRNWKSSVYGIPDN